MDPSGPTSELFDPFVPDPMGSIGVDPIRRQSGPQIDLLNGALYAGDPTPTYRWLRHEAPLYYDEINQIWALSRHADIVGAEKQPHRYSNRNAYRPITNAAPDGDLSMINFDDPRHYQQRRLVNRRFTPKAVTTHEALITEHVHGLIDRVCEAGECDVVEDLAAPLPATMIAHYLGFGAERADDVRRWSELTIPLGGGDRYLSDEVLVSVFEFAGEVEALLARRRAEPADDLISMWAHAEIDGRSMTDAEIVSECLLLVDGGAETTRTVIANTMWELCRHPEQRAKLIDSPDLLDGPAVEEFIRFTTPILNMARAVREDHELYGHELKVGERVLLMYGSANRDEDIFERPDDFDVTRPANQHVAFGFGTHFCLGAALARLELRVMFRALIERLGSWELAGPPPQRIPGAFVRGIAPYRVSFTPSARVGT